MDKETAARNWDSLLFGAERQLSVQGYSSPVIRDNRYIWSRLREYALTRKNAAYSPTLARRFGKDIYRIDIGRSPVTGNRRAARALRVLEDFHATGVIHRRVSVRDVSIPLPYREFCGQLFRNQEEKGVSASTMRQLQRCISDFTQELARIGINSVEKIKHAHVLDFLGKNSREARGTVAKRLYLLRLLFQYACEAGLCEESFLIKFPHLKYIPRAKLPTTFSREEIKRLLLCIDTNTAVGKRDYAILLLAVQLGIRAGDIRSLKLENIYWDEKRISFIQGKTGRAISLPLLPESGWALIDYLKNGRPPSESKNIFLRHLHPFEPFGEFNNLHSILNKYLEQARIDIPNTKRHGLHTLRHSLAGAMLGENIALPVISEALGHTRTQTTQAYLRVDVEHLRACALEVDE